MQGVPTRGEWQAERIGADYRGRNEKGMALRITATEESDPRRTDVALVYYKPEWEEAAANARLIAGAKLMHEALVKIAAESGLEERALRTIARTTLRKLGSL